MGIEQFYEINIDFSESFVRNANKDFETYGRKIEEYLHVTFVNEGRKGLKEFLQRYNRLAGLHFRPEDYETLTTRDNRELFEDSVGAIVLGHSLRHIEEARVQGVFDLETYSWFVGSDLEHVWKSPTELYAADAEMKVNLGRESAISILRGVQRDIRNIDELVHGKDRYPQNLFTYLNGQGLSNLMVRPMEMYEQLYGVYQAESLQTSVEILGGGK